MVYSSSGQDAHTVVHHTHIQDVQVEKKVLPTRCAWNQMMHMVLWLSSCVEKRKRSGVEATVNR